MGEVPSEIIILAKGESRVLCPYDAEVWGVKDVGSYPECIGKRMDKIFDFEPRTPPYDRNVYNEEGLVSSIPIVSWQDYADIKYPLEEIREKFKTSYFTNTVCYQIAYAMYLGVKKIRLYGVDAPFGYPYFLEKAGIEYWVGKAEEYGVRVEISEGSHLLRTKDGQIYGKRVGGSLLLYLTERLALLRILPKTGHWQDVYVSNLTQATLSVTVDEAKEHGVEISTLLDGNVAFKCDREFTKSIWLPDWAWYYLRDLLGGLEANGKLPISLLSVYDKIVKFGRADEEDKKETRVSFIITTKNRASFLKNALENAKKLLTEEDELIVVDGNSTDETKSVINQYGRIITKVIIGDDISAAHAFNKGILSSTGKYVMQYPDDDVIYSTGVNEAVAYMDENPEVDLLVCGGTKKSGGREIRIRAPENYGHHPSDVFTYGACGNGFVYRRSVFPKVGMLDTTHLIPDQEFALRVISQGTVKFLETNIYYHPIYAHSTSIQNRPLWKEQHDELIKRYCSVFYLWKQQLLQNLSRCRQWLRHFRQL